MMFWRQVAPFESYFVNESGRDHRCRSAKGFEPVLAEGRPRNTVFTHVANSGHWDVHLLGKPPNRLVVLPHELANRLRRQPCRAHAWAKQRETAWAQNR